MEKSKLLWLIMLGLWAFNTSGQEVDIDRLLCVPFIDEKNDIESLDSIKSFIRESISTQLKGLQNWPNYDSLENRKAIAIGYSRPSENLFVPFLYRHRYLDFNINRWGGAWDYKSIKKARKAAIEYCEQIQNGHGECIIYLEDEKTLLTDRMVQDYLEVKEDFINQQIDSLKKAELKIVLNDILNLSQLKPRTDTTNISLSGYTPIKIGYPDEQQDYASACQDRIFYSFIKVKDEEIDSINYKLKSIEGLNLFGSYNRSVNTVFDFKEERENRLMEKMSRFINHQRFEKNPLKDSLVTLPYNLSEFFGDKQITEIWTQGSVRITSKGLPLRLDNYQKPIAFGTLDGLYLAIEIKMPDGGDRCYVSKPFTGKAIDLSSCINDQNCEREVLKSLLSNLQIELSKDPISASLIQNEVFAPGEFGLERQYLPSKVLGLPYYELSTYLIETWIAYKENPLYGSYNRQVYKGSNTNRSQTGEELFLFLKVSHILTKSTHKNGTYVEPSLLEVKKYDGNVRKAVNQAIEKTCNDFREGFNNSICNLTKTK